MKKSKRITPEMIKKHFGEDVGIERRLSGVFLVTTSTGGELEIKQDGFSFHSGGEDVYRSITLLAGEAWGGFKASGPREHILACMAHGDVLGVNVTPDAKQKGGGCAKICAVFMVAMIGWPASWIASLFWDQTGEYAGFGITGVAIIAVWQLMTRAQKQEEQRQAQDMRFIYPVQHGTPRDASQDDLQEGGWL